MNEGHEEEIKYSISQAELKTAFEKVKQVYIFVEKGVHIEYETYKANKDTNTEIKYNYVDDVEIYKFLDEVYSWSHNNNIKDFETIDDIINYLREQFAGRFKQMLLDEANKKQMSIINEINNTANTLHKLVDFLTESNKSHDEEFHRIVKLDHPIIAKIKNILDIRYNIYIEGVADFEELMKSHGLIYDETDNQWSGELDDQKVFIQISDLLFENDKLKYMKNEDWKDEYLQVNYIPNKKVNYFDDNDLPF